MLQDEIECAYIKCYMIVYKYDIGIELVDIAFSFNSMSRILPLPPKETATECVYLCLRLNNLQQNIYE